MGCLERLAQAQQQRRADDEKIVGATWDQLTPDQRTTFAAYLHQQHGTTGPAAHPTADQHRTPEVSPSTYTAADTGQRNVVTGPPGEAAATAFGHQALNSPAEANAAQVLVAQAFPKTSLCKPPTITGTGEVRSSTGQTPVQEPRDIDRAR